MSVKHLILVVMMLGSSGALHASCSYPKSWPPSIPDVENTSMASVAALGTEVRNYIETEQLHLERCRERLDAGRFNLRIRYLNEVASEYNALVRFYNRISAELLGSADEA